MRRRVRVHVYSPGGQTDADGVAHQGSKAKVAFALPLPAENSEVLLTVPGIVTETAMLTGPVGNFGPQRTA